MRRGSIGIAERAGSSERSRISRITPTSRCRRLFVQGCSTSRTRRPPRFAASSSKLRFRPRRGGGWGTCGLDRRQVRPYAVGPGNTPVDAAGRRLFNAPEYSGRTFLEYQSQLGAAGALSLWLEALMQSTVYFTALNDPIERQGPWSRQREYHASTASALVYRRFRP